MVMRSRATVTAVQQLSSSSSLLLSLSLSSLFRLPVVVLSSIGSFRCVCSGISSSSSINSFGCTIGRSYSTTTSTTSTAVVSHHRPKKLTKSTVPLPLSFIDRVQVQQQVPINRRCIVGSSSGQQLNWISYSTASHHNHQQQQHFNFRNKHLSSSLSFSKSSSIFLRPTITKTTGTTSTVQQQRPYCMSSISLLAMTAPTNTNTNTNTDNTDTDTSNTMLNVAMCQFQVTDNKQTNIQTASDYIDMAMSGTDNSNNINTNTIETDTNTMKRMKPDIIVLPEIWNSPYATAAFPDYAEYVPEIGTSTTTIIDSSISPSSAFLQAKAIEHSTYIVGGSIPEKEIVTDTSSSSGAGQQYHYYNTCLVFDPAGTIVAKHRKVHLFDINIPNGITFRESDTLQPGNTVSYFNYNNICTIGLGICYDIRFAEYAMLLTQEYNCTVLIYPGAFNMITGPAHWELLQRSRANDNQCYVITASPARTVIPSTPSTTTTTKYPHYTAWGHSTAVGPWGDIIATTNELPSIVYATLDLTKVSSIRQSIPITYQKRTDLYQLVCTSTSTSSS